jgi:hypothetical protein
MKSGRLSPISPPLQSPNSEHKGVTASTDSTRKKALELHAKPSLLPKTKRTMPNIYYCNGLANNGLGTLRAVLSWEETRDLLKLRSVEYAGLQLPTTAQGRVSDFAVLRILDEERDDRWQVGFYSFDGNILQIEEWVQTCIKSRNLPPGRKLGD